MYAATALPYVKHLLVMIVLLIDGSKLVTAVLDTLIAFIKVSTMYYLRVTNQHKVEPSSSSDFMELYGVYVIENLIDTEHVYILATA
jgi:hypothetical protein